MLEWLLGCEILLQILLLVLREVSVLLLKLLLLLWELPLQLG